MDLFSSRKFVTLWDVVHLVSFPFVCLFAQPSGDF